MSSGRASAPARTTLATVGVGIAALSVAVVGTGGRGATYGGASTWFAALEVGVTFALLAAALLLLAERTTASAGAFLTAASTVWLAPLWIGWQSGESVARAIAAMVAPLLVAILLGAVVVIAPAPFPRAAVLALATLAVLAVAALSIAAVVVRDPLRDLYCWSDCTVQPLFDHVDMSLARRFSSALLWTNVAVGLAVGLLAAARLAVGGRIVRRSAGPALVAAAAAGLALTAYAAALLSEPREDPSRPLYRWLFVARALALLAFAGGLAWLAIRPRLVRSRVTRLAVDVERSAAEGGLARLLATAVGDATLRLLYPVGGRPRVVDADGRAVEADDAAPFTPLVGEDGVLALVDSRASTVEALERELGPAAELALGNERLRAESLAHLRDLTASRAGIVEAADAARRRMERDLHDGAQQRLLALTYDLRVALTIAESSRDTRAAAPLRRALERTAAASEDLRDIAHGIFPAELTASGLAAALESLADEHPLHLSVELPRGRRYRSDVEAAAYAVVHDALELGGGPVDISLAEQQGRLNLTIQHAEQWSDRLLYVEDRVHAAGGDVVADGQTVTVTLPARAR